MAAKTFNEWYTTDFNVYGGNDETADRIRYYCNVTWDAATISAEEKCDSLSRVHKKQLKAEVALCIDRYVVAINQPICKLELSAFINELRQLLAVY